MLFTGHLLPVTREEFEGRAVLYHIMMDLEEFLLYKKRFIESLSEKQKRIYWETEKKGMNWGHCAELGPPFMIE